uniref:Uncharacterized protein n=1 Tax=Sphaeramia orbicularis TaxID=375764 RepID=A0A672ZYW5_9TELE
MSENDKQGIPEPAEKKCIRIYKKYTYRNNNSIRGWGGAWVDEVWDLEFTEKKSLDDTIEEDLTASDEKAFRDLYQCLLAHTAEQQQSTDTDAASQVKLV